jgi:signal transduction histidine kinase
VQEQNMTVKELKASVPDVLKDLNYTVGLMDNLLQWAKSQMQSGAIRFQPVHIWQTVQEIVQPLNLQAKAKQIHLFNQADTRVHALADKDMISLVIRNLVSNAIKFTPCGGTVSIGVHEHASFVEVYVKDSGAGIGPAALQKINGNNFYTTHGTTGESGTGLGLMLCKEFLLRHHSQLHIESEPGLGATFSFSLSKPSA